MEYGPLYLVHAYIDTYINEFLMCNTVKQSLNQRHGQLLGEGDYETRELNVIIFFKGLISINPFLSIFCLQLIVLFVFDFIINIFCGRFFRIQG